MTATMFPTTEYRRIDHTGDHDRFAHIVIPACRVMEAYVTGRPVVALCGKEWVPSRDPDALPVCPTCKELWAALP